MPTRPDVVPPGSPPEIAAALVDTFREGTGVSPEGVYAAPGRVNLIGEHLDYNGGRCLPVALPHACYVAAARRPGDTVRVRSRQADDAWEGRIGDLSPGDVSGWAGYAVGVLWALRKDGIDLPGLDLLVDGRVPLGAGLSSSAALEVSVALAACAAAGLSVEPVETRERIVASCMRAENEFVGAPTGGMDQAVAVFAQAGHALLVDFADGSRRDVPWDPVSAGLALLVVDTRVQHALSDGSYGDRRAESEAAARALGVDRLVDAEESSLTSLTDDQPLRRARHVVTEQARVDAAVEALIRNDVTALGPLLTASHRSLRDDYEVSCEELDVVVDTALAAGALGARMTGGGFGGSAIVLVHADRLALVAGAVAEAFHDHGWEPPAVLEAAPAPPARQVR